MLADSKLAKIDICLILFCCETLTQARACECVMGVSLDTMCQNTIVFASKTDRMVIWTKLSSKFGQFDQKYLQYLEFEFC